MHKILTTFTRTLRILILSIVLLSASVSSLASQSSYADTAPAAGTPATVSADPLPTVQIESSGVVYAQVVVGNTVYATGKFSTARPAGAAEGQDTVARSGLLAYDITTGNLITSFDHNLNSGATGDALAVSPDHTKLYVGGSFSTIDGQAHANIAEINLTTNTVVSSFNQGTNSEVAALAATNTTVYAGGDFTKASSGATRDRLIAFSSTGTLLPWAPAANAQVHAMVLTTDGTKVIVGGSFSTLNGKAYHGTGAVSPTGAGAPVAWASQSASYLIRDDNSNAGITSLSTDGRYIYLSAYNYGGTQGGGFEGTAAVNHATGAIVWVNDCHGDTYSAFPVNDLLYSTGHAHDCQSIGTFPETYPRSFHAALVSTTSPSGTNSYFGTYYNSFAGVPKSTQLDWYPDIAKGTATGLDQAAWSVSGNSQYVVLGGEFPSVNGIAQDGLVRFGVAAVATNQSGPIAYSGNVVKASAVESDGTDTVTFPATYDRDNATLTYTVYRDGNTTTPVKTITATSDFWNLQTLELRDSGLVPGSQHTYKVVVSDPFGNTTTGHSEPAAGCHVTQGSVNTLCAGEVLPSGQALYSNNGNYRLAMQTDGNLVLYNKAGKAIWNTKTSKAADTYATLTLQTDGNIVVHTPAGAAAWNASTQGKKGVSLTIQDDGNLVLHTAAGAAVWYTATQGK